MEPLTKKLLDDVVALRAADPNRVTVVGIDGPTAAGKTTLALALAESLHDSGVETWILQLDWTLRGRDEREADVAHLRSIDAAFEYEGELHMRLGTATRALEAVASFNRQADLGRLDETRLVLEELYSRANGGTVDGEETLVLRPGLVVIVEGHYTLRTELDAHIDHNIVLLSDPDELVRRKVARVKGYRSPDDAVHYFWHTDLPSFNHHLARFGSNADVVVDNTDYTRPKEIGQAGMTSWLSDASEVSIAAPRRLEGLSDVAQYVFSESTLVCDELSRILDAGIAAVLEWDRMVGQYLRVAIDEVEEDLETLATRAIESLNHEFSASPYRARLSHHDSLYHVYHRQLPLTLGIEFYGAESGRTVMTVLAEVDRDRLDVGVFWEGGVTWIDFERPLGGIDRADLRLRSGDRDSGLGTHAADLQVFLPTEFAVPSFLDGLSLNPVFIGREQENISASRVLRSVLQDGGVWIHRFALHREIKFFQYCLGVQGAHSIHVGNYLIAVKSSDAGVRQRFREFRHQWATPPDRAAVTALGHVEYDRAVEAEKAEVREYVEKHCRHLHIKDGTLFGNVYDRGAFDAILKELATLLRSPHRLLRKRVIQFIDESFPGFAVRTEELWPDVPPNSKTTLSLGELTGLSSSIMAEVYLWLALRNDRAAVLGANVYDIRSTSLDARAFLDAAAERGCPIVLQCSMNAVGQKEVEDDKTYHGYLKPENGVEDFVGAARRAARDLYLQTGKRAPLFGVGLDHVNVENDYPPHRAKRFLQHAIRSGGVTHVVLDGSDLFDLTGSDSDELAGVYRRMGDWVLDLMNSPDDTFLKDMEVCISELNYVGSGSDAYVPSTEDIRLFSETYGDALAERGFAAHIPRPKLFISNLGTRHHSTDDVLPWVERSEEWRDAIKNDGFVSAVLHGTTNSHQDTLAASTVGCHKVNVAGDFLHTLVDNLPMRLSRLIQESETQPKMMLPQLRPDMERFSVAEADKVYGALKEHCSRLLKTIDSPKLSSMDVNYFQYKDFDFTDEQVEAILTQVTRERTDLMPSAPRALADSRQGSAFAASMIEVPYSEFRGPLLDALWDEGIRHFHVDAGDGVFISRSFTGVDKVEYLREHFPDAVIHVHLMVTNPHYPKDGEFAEIQQYAEAGADAIAIHLRSCGSFEEGVSALKIIRKLNVRPGIVIETSDSVDERLEALIEDLALDWVVVMGVPIGYGGQVFQYSTLNRISRLHDLAGRLDRDFLVECDGGLNFQNLDLCRNAGGQLFSGWSIIKGKSIDEVRGNVKAVAAQLGAS